MNYTRRVWIQLAAASSVTAMTGLPAHAFNTFDPARICIGFPPGTTTDVLARKLGERFVPDYARSVVVDNRLGAGGQLAVTSVKGASADGSTILLTPMSMLGLYPFTYKRLPYDPFLDLTPVAMTATMDCGIGVGPSVPESVKTVPDLMRWFQANPGRASIGSPATGSTLHFAGIWLGKAAGVEVTHVGYKGSGPAIIDMIGGNLPALCSSLGAFLNQPKLRLLATTGSKRSKFTPTVPTLVEQGFKDMVFQEWYGLYLPANASKEVVSRLSAAARSALDAPDVVQGLEAVGMDATWSTQEDLVVALKSAQSRWGSIVKSIGFTADS